MPGPKSYRFGHSRRVLIASVGAMSGVTVTTPQRSPNTQSIYTLCAMSPEETGKLVGVKISAYQGVTGGANRGALNISSDGGKTIFEYCPAGVDFVEESVNASELVIGGDAGAVTNVLIILKFGS